MKVGYLGPEGTFTHYACKKATKSFQDIKLVEYQSLDQLFDALSDNNVDSIFTPIENSIEGPVNRVLDALTHNDHVFVEKRFSMKINQSMLSFNRNINYPSIQHIISMPHAIAQCYSFIKKNCPDASLHHAPSTAGSVPLIDALNLPKNETVVIGHQGISNFFPIHVIEENIQDQKQNLTQFCLINRKQRLEEINSEIQHCLLAFSTQRDAPGSLLNVLNIFKSNEINLTKILSRPEKSTMGTYIFYIEFSIDFSSIDFNDLINNIKNHSLFFKLIGLYGSQEIND